MARLGLLFVHVVGALGMFGALAIEGASLRQMARADDASRVRTALTMFRSVRAVGIPSLLLVVGSGIALASTVWGWRAAWIDVAIATLIAVAAIGALLTGRQTARLNEATARLALPVLWSSFVLRTSLLTGIVFLMTVKPPLDASLTATATAACIGLLIGYPSARRSSAAHAGIG